MEIPNIKLKHFYTYGIVVFGAVFSFNFVTLKYDWFLMTISARGSAIAMLCFNILIMWLFYTFRNQEIAKEVEPITEELADEILK